MCQKLIHFELKLKELNAFNFSDKIEKGTLVAKPCMHIHLLRSFVRRLRCGAVHLQCKCAGAVQRGDGL